MSLGKIEHEFGRIGQELFEHPPAVPQVRYLMPEPTQNAGDCLDGDRAVEFLLKVVGETELRRLLGFQVIGDADPHLSLVLGHSSLAISYQLAANDQ